MQKQDRGLNGKGFKLLSLATALQPQDEGKLFGALASYSPATTIWL
jgi:hypothetical protein